MAHEEPEGELARLRDRTDEIELIISGLTIVALFTLPGWLFELLADRYSHLSVAMMVGSSLGIVLITGLCYGLAACFVLHLLSRAYWVGLIGLRTTFPDGINWNKTPGIGPLTRDHYRRHLPDLKTAIERADRLASPAPVSALPAAAQQPDGRQTLPAGPGSCWPRLSAPALGGSA